MSNNDKINNHFEETWQNQNDQYSAQPTLNNWNERMSDLRNEGVNESLNVNSLNVKSIKIKRKNCIIKKFFVTLQRLNEILPNK